MDVLKSKKPERLDSAWETVKKANSVARKYKKWGISARVSMYALPKWDNPTVYGVYTNVAEMTTVKKSIRAAAKKKFPDARSITVIFDFGDAEIQVNTRKVYVVTKTKTGFSFKEWK